MMDTAATIWVENEIRRLEQEHPSRSAYYREQWMRERAAASQTERHRLARWTGDRLVEAGERLRAWAAPRVVPNGR